ncbi:PEP-CTERM sorting domain-containing protein [Peristeroidobacter agariperforans]|uniref:PEP-CTERM sorting domain-containing protein n=1 Tax=Peristeroidobacter agariperforans TaxID=268404 RepID=UPI00101E1E3F|nr:PEP-CTERM sorting domain-containing protein [Peristeroidobacter agariperforans]
MITKLKRTASPLLLCIATSSASATVITYDDGATHNLTGPLIADIKLASPDTHLVIGPGGTLIGNVEGQGRLTVAGGTLAGTTNYSGHVVIVESGTVTGAITGWAGHADERVAEVQIHGGNVLGGVFTDNQEILITGGYVGGWGADWIFTDFTMTGGIVDGGLYSDAAWEIAITGGIITGNMFFDDYNDTWNSRVITGGTFTAANMYASSPLLSLYTNLDIFGGQFAQNEFHVGDEGALNIYGRNFRFTDGLLSGYLTDGNWLSQRIVVTGTGALNIHDVPEPSVIALFAFGLFGVAIVRRKMPRVIRPTHV